ncbi:hypothetical protein Dimus_007815, partial [Dionaea muscipula]
MGLAAQGKQRVAAADARRARRPANLRTGRQAMCGWRRPAPRGTRGQRTGGGDVERSTGRAPATQLNRFSSD